MNISQHLAWLVPVLVVIVTYFIIAIIDFHDIKTTVRHVEQKQTLNEEKYIREIDSLDYRVRRIEEFCCGEVEEIKHRNKE